MRMIWTMLISLIYTFSIGQNCLFIIVLVHIFYMQNALLKKKIRLKRRKELTFSEHLA